MTLAPATPATLLPGAGRLMGRQFLGFCVMLTLFSLCLAPPSFLLSSVPFSNLECGCPGEDSPHRQSQCQDNQAEERGGGVPPSDPQLPASPGPTSPGKASCGLV